MVTRSLWQIAQRERYSLSSFTKTSVFQVRTWLRESGRSQCRRMAVTLLRRAATRQHDSGAVKLGDSSASSLRSLVSATHQTTNMKVVIFGAWRSRTTVDLSQQAVTEAIFEFGRYRLAISYSKPVPLAEHRIRQAYR